MSQRHPKRRSSRHESSISPEDAKRSKDAGCSWRLREEADRLEVEAVVWAKLCGYHASGFDRVMARVRRLRAQAEQTERSGEQLVESGRKR
jgi:hypothetical protein